MTNFEKIKNMSPEEMAKLINDVAVCCFQDANCENCPIYCSRDEVYCNSSIIGKWLNSEVDK
jgi:hypothetical protein|nr:MAG TPA: hypothetical protein [Caudoviricetes sp.]